MQRNRINLYLETWKIDGLQNAMATPFGQDNIKNVLHSNQLSIAVGFIIA